MNKVEVRRYNFIVGTHCLYSGLFRKVGFFGGKQLRLSLKGKARMIAMNYDVPVSLIKVSNTLRRDK